MQKLLLRVFAALLALTGTTVIAEAQKLTPREGVVRVKVDPATAATLGRERINAKKGKMSLPSSPRLQASLEQIQVVGIRPVFPYSEKFAEQRAKFGLDLWYEIEFATQVKSEQARKVMQQTPGILRAETLVPMKQLEGNGKFRVQSQLPQRAAGVKYPFNDPRLPSQWHYQNFGNSAQMVAGADINAFEAWKTTTGSPDVLVAIIDGGIDYTHEDLAANMYVNEAELNGTPGVDDDGNGYVDDIYGYNFCSNSGQIYPHPHGTHVAGTVAAVNNNGIGVCGVAGGDGTPGSGVRMLSCQVFDSRSGVPSEGDFAAALVYAAEKGASIASCSWGWDVDGYYEESVLDAVRYFTQMARSDKLLGGLCIFSTGNSGVTGQLYPACMPEVLSVASMTSEYQPAPYSVYGDWVSVIAPGGFMDYDTSQGVLSTLPGNLYGFNEGTSMATPHVSGIAALVLSKHGSSTLPATTLRQQIETSVNDFYAANPEARGLYGSGNVDAAKALLWSNGTAPEPVSVFAVYPAQNEIYVHWTIPASSDNNVNHHVIYYSKQPFTAQSDLSAIPNLVVDTKFLSSGDEATAVIEGLEPLTPYYVAMQAVDRWGERSSLSEVVQTTTNAGPQMTLDKSSLSISNNGTSHGSASFTIGNEAEGLLKWSVGASTVQSSISPMSIDNIPAQPAVPYTGTLGSEKAPIAATNVISVTDYNADDYPQSISYYESLYAFIGDSDKTLPNALAQHFTVSATDYPEGFNLTALRVDGAFGTDPLFKIYKGNGMIDESRKLLEFKPDWFGYYNNVTMPEQLWFAPGESFWVTVSFEPGEELYPLGLAEAAVTDTSATNAFMSNDRGKTWTRLSEALRGSRYEFMADRATWAVTAVSLNPDWSKILEIKPASGELPQGETATVLVGTGDSQLCNGTYQLSLNFETNESGAAKHRLPVTLEVSGQKPVIRFNKVVDFGSLLVGQSKKVTVELFNEGYGTFGGDSFSPGIWSDKISSTNANFLGPDYVATGFPARQATRFELTFKPLEAGSHSGEIIFTDKYGNTITLAVQGVATDPAKMVFEPQTVDAGSIEPGAEPVEKTFVIKNEGRYPLQFAFPKYTNENIDGIAADNTHKFGYSWTSNFSDMGGIEYEAPSFATTTEVTSQFTDQVNWTKAIPLGFDFPYYGKTYNEVYITSFGGVGFEPLTEGYMFPPLSADSYGVGETAMISAFGSALKMSPDSKIEYAKKDGKFWVSYSNVMADVYDTETWPISFRMALSPTGDVEMYYDDYEGYLLFGGGKNLFVGVNDPGAHDPMTVTSAEVVNAAEEAGDISSLVYANFTSGTAVKIIAPSPCIVTDVTPAYGLITPGKSLEIKATVAAGDDIYAGPTTTNLVVISNDPLAPSAHVSFTADIVGDALQPEAQLTSDKIDLGDVFRTSLATAAVNVKNTGRAAMQLTAVSFADGNVTSDVELPAVIPAGQSKDVLVTFPTDKEGEVKDVVTITTDCGTVTASLRANVIGCPAFTPAYASLDVEMPARTREEHPLTITNDGNAPLEFSLAAGKMISYSPNLAATKSVRYDYSATIDDKKVKFDWVDIETNGLGEQNNLSYYMANDYVEVKLPFNFPYYGKTYNKMYIYNTGFVSFTKRNDDHIWPEPPAGFPGETIYTNVIAPYWGMHSMDQTKTAGTYHYVTDDTAVVSFMEYGNSMNIGVCFQLVMRKDGTFKFQYKGNDEHSTIFNIFGVAGISNPDGTEGINLSSRYVQFGNAIEFSPVATIGLAPGKSLTADIAIDATNTLAGTYETSIMASTNVPGKEKVVIPVNVTLTGVAAPAYSADPSIEMPAGATSFDLTDPMVQMGANYALYFTVANEGTAPFTITGIRNGGPVVEDEWMGPSPAFNVFGYLEETDWITGEPTGYYQWQPLDYGFSPVTVGLNPVKFAVPMMWNEQWTTPGTYEVPVTLYLEGADVAEKTITCTFVVTPAPVMTLDRQEIAVKNVSSVYEGVQTLKVTNDGEYALKFSAELDLTGKGYDPFDGDDGGGGVAPAIESRSIGTEIDGTLRGGLRAIKPFEYGTDDDYLNLPQEFDFLNGLYYPVVPETKAIYNYGAGTKYGLFSASTAFTAPEEGFNISHIYMCYKPGAYKNTDITVRVVKGDDPGSEMELGRGKLHVDGYTGNEAKQSRFVLVPLEKPVYLAPGQEFCVNIDFPAGEEWPATLIAKQEAVISNRYMAYTEGDGWFDVASLFKDQYGSIGYLTACIETSEGQSWAKLLTDSGEITLTPGESAEIEVSISAAAAPMNSGNMAMLVLKGNDPALPYANIPVTLDKNAAPAIKGAEHIVEVAEGSAATVNLTVQDADGDRITLEVTEGKGRFILATPLSADGAAVIAADGLGVEITGAQGAAVTLEISAGFGDEGSHSVKLRAEDTDENISRATLLYNVTHTNRAPVALETADLQVPLGGSSEPVSLAAMFSDPDDADGSSLTYSVQLADESVATLFVSADSMMLYGDKVGTTTAIVTARDAEGLSAENNLKVVVTDLSSIDSVKTDGNAEVWPVPMTDVLNVRFGFDANDVRVTLYTANGAKVTETIVDVNEGDVVTLQVGNLDKGAYLLSVDAGSESFARVVMK